MAGLCHPIAASKLVKTLRNEVGIPVHFHTHDSSGISSSSVIKAVEAGVDVVDLAISSMSGCTSQPNLNSIVHALRNAPRSTGLDVDSLNQLSIYWKLLGNITLLLTHHLLLAVQRYFSIKCLVGSIQICGSRHPHWV